MSLHMVGITPAEVYIGFQGQSVKPAFTGQGFQVYVTGINIERKRLILTGHIGRSHRINVQPRISHTYRCGIFSCTGVDMGGDIMVFPIAINYTLYLNTGRPAYLSVTQLSVTVHTRIDISYSRQGVGYASKQVISAKTLKHGTAGKMQRAGTRTAILHIYVHITGS